MNNRKTTLVVRERRTLDDGHFAEIVIWKLPQPVPPCLHLYKYRLVYIVNGTRAVGFDNERGKGDHCHFGAQQFAYVFRGIPTLLADFDHEIKRWNNGNPGDRHS